MRRFLVLGASGFIGRHVLAALLEGGENAALLCTRRSGYQDRTENKIATRIASVSGSVADSERRDNTVLPAPPETVTTPSWLRLDLTSTSAEELADVFQRFQPDAIINCTGSTEGTVRDLFQVNTVAVDTLLRAVELGTPSVRVVQLGSAAEYGAVAAGTAIREEQCAKPRSPYGVSKLAATQLVSNAHASGRVDAVVLRVFNPIGPGLAASSVLGQAAVRLRRAVDEGRDAITMGSLEAFRDFVDVRDVARAVVEAIRVVRPAQPVFNIAAGEGMQVRQLVRRLADCAGFTGAIDELAPGSPRSNEVSWQEANVERASTCLGWSPHVSLDSSIQAVWDSNATT